MHYSFLVILPEGFQGDSDKVISYVEKTLRPYVIFDFSEMTEMGVKEWLPPDEPEEYNVDPMIDRWYISNDLPNPGWMLVNELPADYIPEAVVTPDGVWHGNEETHRFADARDPGWVEAYRQIITDYPRHLAVGAGGHF